MIEPLTLLLLVSAGFIAGMINAIAGGGTFFTFPALLSVGLPPVIANATSALAVWPGHAAAVPVAWRTLASVGRGLPIRCALALTGGLVGAGLLLLTADRVFTALVPWLMLLATLLFAAGPKLRMWLPPLRRGGGRLAPLGLVMEFVVSVYGGYFGAGLGVLLIATLSLSGYEDLREANALKNLLASIVSSVAVLTFVLAGAISWPHALPALGGAIIGGALGARAAQRVPATWLRLGVIAFGAALTLHFMARVYG